jgi:hypothetical protein
MKQAVAHALAWTFTTFFALIALTLVGFTFGPQLESQLFPLFTGIKGAYVSSDGSHVDLLVTGVKSRNCILVAVSAKVLVDGHWVSGHASMKNQDGTPLTIQNQRIATGSPFVRLMHIEPGGPSVRLVADSRCHIMWMSQQHFQEFSIVPK